MATGPASKAVGDQWETVSGPPPSSEWETVSGPSKPELPPFPVDAWHDDQIKHLPPENQAEKRNGFASTMYEFAKPWMDAGYSAGASLNRGLANFATEWEQVYKGLERGFGQQPEGTKISGGIKGVFANVHTPTDTAIENFFNRASQEFNANADFWQNEMSKEGVGAIDKLFRFVGSSLGAAAPGAAQFMAEWGSLLTVPALSGYERSSQAHEVDPVTAGLKKAVETGTLATVFGSIAPLRRWLQAGILGTFFGADEALQAPPGKRLEAVGKGYATAGLLTLMTPSGKYGLKDIYSEIVGAAPKQASAEPVEVSKVENLNPVMQRKSTGEIQWGEEGSDHPEIIGANDNPKVMMTELEDNHALANYVVDYRGNQSPDVVARAEQLKSEAPKPSETAPEPDKTPGIEPEPQTPEGAVEQLYDHKFANPRTGETLDREQAKSWYKKNRPEIYQAWLNITNDPKAPFHAPDLASAIENVEGAKVEGVHDVGDLTASLRNLSADATLKERVSLADQTRKTYEGSKANVKNSFSTLKSTAAAVWDWYKRPPQWTGVRAMIDRYKGGNQISNMEVGRFSRQIQETYSPRTQEAMSAYLRAGGDDATLNQWADATTDASLKRKYVDARSLTEEQKGFAQDVRSHMDEMGQKAIDAGFLDHMIDNYLPQIWEKADNPTANRLRAESNSGLLHRNPFFAKKRIFENEFEGEQAGYKPKNAQVGYGITAWHRAYDEAAAARSFIRELTDRKASDGRPMALTAGVGSTLPKGERPAEAWLVKPHAVSYKTWEPDPVTGEKLRTTVDVSDYSNRGIDHPALRNWKWASADNEGKPIFVQGDLVFHPEAYGDVKNFLSTSAIRRYAVGRAALRLSSELKGTMLGFFSPFHQVHLGDTAVMHGSSPFRPPEIDLNDALTRDLIEHGHMLYDGHAMSEWAEGLSGPGVVRFIPKVGDYATRYTEYLFGLDGFIPRLKNYMAHIIYERNVSRYPELSRDQVLVLTADQSNAAFGHQNWRGLASNKTFQDILRISALAPDFLISRMKQVGQAVKPYGREQFTALGIRGGIGLFVAYKTIEGILSLIDPDHNEVHLDRPFSVTIDGKEYSIRTETGDIYHILRDPRGFAYYRLNPFIAKPAIEAITGRDRYGRLRDPSEQLKDWATTAVPIAGQGYFTKQDYNLYQSILQSIGITSWDARTNAEQMARQIAGEKSKAEYPEVTRERLQARSKLKKDFSKTGDFSPVRQAWHEGKISIRDAQWIIGKSIKDELPSMVESFTVPESLKVWKEGTQEEKAELRGMILMKWIHWQTAASPAELNAYKGEVQEVAKWKPTRPLKKRGGFSIQK